MILTELLQWSQIMLWFGFVATSLVWWLFRQHKKYAMQIAWRQETHSKELRHLLEVMAREDEKNLTKISERDYAMYGVPKELPEPQCCCDPDEEIIDLVRAEDWTPKSFIKLRKETRP